MVTRLPNDTPSTISPEMGRAVRLMDSANRAYYRLHWVIACGDGDDDGDDDDEDNEDEDNEDEDYIRWR